MMAPGELWKRKAAIMSDLKTIAKRGTNRGYGESYQYVTDADMLDAVRPLMAKHGVSMAVAIDDIERIPITSKKGATGHHVTIRQTYTMGCEGDEPHVTPWISEAVDFGDKGVSKAIVLAEKYFLKATFAISTYEKRDDPDAETHDVEYSNVGNIPNPNGGARKPGRTNKGSNIDAGAAYQRLWKRAWDRAVWTSDDWKRLRDAVIVKFPTQTDFVQAVLDAFETGMLPDGAGVGDAIALFAPDTKGVKMPPAPPDDIDINAVEPVPFDEVT